MRKPLLVTTTIILALFCFSCDNEPVDFTVEVESVDSGNPTGEDPNDSDDGDDDMDDDGNPNTSMQLSGYDYMKSFDANGDTSTFSTDFTINSQNQFTAQQTTIQIFGTTVVGTATINRNPSSQIIRSRTVVGGTTTNETNVSYLLGKISEITYEDFEDASENYTFIFSHNNNVVTREKQGTTYSTKFTFNDNGKLTLRETMENGAVVKTENITYDTTGNLTSAVITGQDANSFTYTYDSNTNPLRLTMNDLYTFSILNDEYDDQYEHWQAVIYSQNNLVSASTSQGSSNLAIQYDAGNRIISRSGTLYSSLPNASSDVTISINENFQYIN